VTNEIDPTENARREMQAAINSQAAERAALEAKHGQVWNTDEMRTDFTPLGFAAPFIVVIRNLDGKKGSLMFQHSPRLYFNWQED